MLIYNRTLRQSYIKVLQFFHNKMFLNRIIRPTKPTVFIFFLCLYTSSLITNYKLLPHHIRSSRLLNSKISWLSLLKLDKYKRLRSSFLIKRMMHFINLAILCHKCLQILHLYPLIISTYIDNIGYIFVHLLLLLLFLLILKSFTNLKFLF